MTGVNFRLECLKLNISKEGLQLQNANSLNGTTFVSILLSATSKKCHNIASGIDKNYHLIVLKQTKLLTESDNKWLMISCMHVN